MIGIKDQCFGVEIELTGITRAEAAEALAAYFETTPQRSYDNYDIFIYSLGRRSTVSVQISVCLIVDIRTQKVTV